MYGIINVHEFPDGEVNLLRRNESFNTDAQLYDEMRPPYDSSVIDWIINKTGVTERDQLIEIGPGTGQATLPFAERGLSIHCIELGEKLAAILKRKCERYPQVTVDVSPFETWESDTVPQPRLIYSAAAFHWIDKQVKYKKCSDLLVDHGFLALMWHEHTDDTPDIIVKSYELLERYSDKSFHYPSRQERRQKRINEIDHSGYFTFCEAFEHKWMTEQTPDEYLQAFKTQSSYLSLDDSSKKRLSEELANLLAGCDQPIRKAYVTAVYLARKKSLSCVESEA
ncbi:rRNA adenine N-6-methyltransferase family protein [Paenibacillus sp. OAS669]|uniref:rRNA adenine N-6-methyltransferase family protein n=1 Tax=Paenibacillus sp. OAS669 TaxID=2663821 RepID=UPI001789D742|nr:rRNA adenine N-6-methyltransferase family protein [Paenibacillus sp. OAS669]MBE1446802.1 hypothetical protein [Paenibacillus sp. OAS669]